MAGGRTYHLSEGTRDEIIQRLKALDCSRAWKITLEPWRERRTSEQNARLWLLHTEASEVTGYTPLEMHELALMRHFGADEKMAGGQVLMVPRKRSSTRDVKEFSEFMEATEAWYAVEFGVWLEH